MNTSWKNIIKQLMLKNKYKKISFGDNIRILGKLPNIKIFDGSKCNIGNNVVINSDFKNSNTSLSNTCKFVLGYTGELRIGDNTMLNGCCITAYKNVVIGKNCQIASFTLITDTDFHPVDPFERNKQVMMQNYNIDMVSKKDVIIGNNVWIGWGSIILKGTIIGDNCVIGAGSLVSGEFPDNVVIAGNPARIIKRI